MGVINLTPDSFSDPGENLGIDRLKKKMDLMLRGGIKILDIGAESTAPMNTPIDSQEEIRRFETFLFPYIEQDPPYFQQWSYSIDTYRPETFLKVHDFLKAHGCHQGLIWNDISGLFDSSVLDILAQTQAQYVFCHNWSMNRFSGPKHLDWAKQECSWQDVVSFLTPKDLRPFQDRIWLDPCLGFSKTLEQNLELVKNMPKILKALESYRLLIGISRKSFLKKQIEFEGPHSHRSHQVEYLHTSLLAFWLGLIPPFQKVLFRLHDPTVWSCALRSSSLAYGGSL